MTQQSLARSGTAGQHASQASQPQRPGQAKRQDLRGPRHGIGPCRQPGPGAALGNRRAGGRAAPNPNPPKLRSCEHCAKEYSARDMRKHLPQCPASYMSRINRRREKRLQRFKTTIKQLNQP